MSDNNKTTMGEGRISIPVNKVPIPPASAEVFSTCCDYCIVACGYKVYRWPVGSSGGAKANENAFKADFPREAMGGNWVSPNQHNVVDVGGKKHNVVIVPDKDIQAVNLKGNHSIRGGCIAKKVYNPDSPTKDRLQHPLLRVNGKFERISWDDAIEIAANMSTYVIDKFGTHAWAQKMFSYQYYENTYALTRLSLKYIKTVAFAVHDNPSDAPSVPGLRDAGFENFPASYEDWANADTLVISGTDPYETKTILWSEWIMAGIKKGMKVIFINPRKTPGPAYAEANGGMLMQINPGTDTLVQNAIARVILENGWEDSEWIKQYINNKWETDSGFGQGTRNTPWQWRSTWGKLQTKGFEDFKAWVLAQKEAEVDFVAKEAGIPAAQIRQAAEWMAKPKADGTRPKTSIAIEKGNYWSNNYLNTASIASLALICGTGNRPARVLSRLGGHQRGGRRGGKYPKNRSPEKFVGRRRKTLDLDRWLEAGHVRFAHVVGCTWMNAMCATGGIANKFEEQISKNPNQVSSKDKAAVIATLKKRVDSGGMVMVNQEIYMREIGQKYADLVLPAATWGEEDFTRANGERRVRLYEKFYDPPGEAKPDWWIAAQWAKKMGFDGFDWKDSNDVFEESARFGRGSRTDYYPLVWMAKKRGMRGHDLLKTYGTTGIQAPIRYEHGKLVGTKRLMDSTLKLPETGPQGPTVHKKQLTQFKSQTGKANLMKSPWSLFEDFYDYMKPKGDELWISNGRINEIWQSGFDDLLRRPYIRERWPANFMEIHPDDAKARGIENGDMIAAESARIPVQTGGFINVDLQDALFAGLQKNGHIKLVSGKVEAVAIVTDVVKKGMAYMYFLYPGQSANTLTPRVADPLTNNYRYKMASGKVRKIGESPFKNKLNAMSLRTRNII